MLHPDARCVRAKMTLFMRLWMARYRYEQLRPFGNTPAETLRFHLRQLEIRWRRVTTFQKALGLEVQPFAPQDEFETIYIASAYAQRELESPRNTIIDCTDRWREYLFHLNSLSHEANPFDFSDICAQCHRAIQEINGTLDPDDGKIIPLRQHELPFAERSPAGSR